MPKIWGDEFVEHWGAYQKGKLSSKDKSILESFDLSRTRMQDLGHLERFYRLEMEFVTITTNPKASHGKDIKIDLKPYGYKISGFSRSPWSLAHPQSDPLVHFSRTSSYQHLIWRMFELYAGTPEYRYRPLIPFETYSEQLDGQLAHILQDLFPDAAKKILSKDSVHLRTGKLFASVPSLSLGITAMPSMLDYTKRIPELVVALAEQGISKKEVEERMLRKVSAMLQNSAQFQRSPEYALQLLSEINHGR